MRKIAILLVSASFVLASLGSAAAANTVITLDKTTNIVSPGENIGVKVTNFPQRAGIYLMQCVEPAQGTRPTVCNTAVQLWISALPGASFTPTAAISMKLEAKFGTTDCSQMKCGVFTRFDHTAPGDFSVDQFIPITFAPGTQNLVLVKSSVKMGKSVKLPSATDAGSILSYRVVSKSRGICSISNGSIKAIKPGTCNLTASAAEINGKEKFTQKIKIIVKK